MTAHHEARADCLAALRKYSLLDVSTVVDLRGRRAGELTITELELVLDAAREGELLDAHLVSLGDLGRKDIRHKPGDAGTSKSFEDALAYFDGFAPLELSVITGNHDLEGLDEFGTDEANLQAWMKCFSLDAPWWAKQVARRTLIVGLSTTRFRESPYSSHEVFISDEQICWFERTLQQHPASDGWKVLVFSHAPPMGSGLRVLQGVHIRNGCAWLNHCGTPEQSRAFLRLVREHSQIKLWASGHFHLSHNYEDAICFREGCAFVHTGVVGPKSTRDACRQTRLVQSDEARLRILTVTHHLRDEAGDAIVRLDAELDYASGELVLDYASGELVLEHGSEDMTTAIAAVCWWQMADGRTLGVHGGQVVEYDAETLSPLGIVVEKERLLGRAVVVVNEGEALVLIDNRAEGVPPLVEVIHPNDDGSYWLRLQRNKRVRQAEKLREQLASEWVAQQRNAAS
ncbi:Metallo-dependent phosphatase-like protein [Pavlovales sp. CCMP2436]|nr:Metallo-dependent phosphatase-like protein [Pavlovales sp. CCMP2436]